VKAFLDTSVLVATFYGDMSTMTRAALFVRLNKKSGCAAAHCLAEVYSVLTGMPGKDRASPDEVLLFLADVRERLTLVALDGEEYTRVLEDAAAAEITGGGIYDAIIGGCAMKAKAEAIYTWNTKHFARLHADMASHAKTP
jgi:predicted nucleic acid-binding protein